jgi:hypothetical protein
MFVPFSPKEARARNMDKLKKFKGKNHEKTEMPTQRQQNPVKID